MTDELNETTKPSSPVIEFPHSMIDNQVNQTTPIVESPHPTIDTQIVECVDLTIKIQPNISSIHSPV